MGDTDSVKIVRLSGELEMGRKSEIRDALAAATGIEPALLDLSEVTYADSIALTELLRFCANAQRQGRPVAVLVQTPQFARLVQYAGLASAFKMFRDRDNALEYLAGCPSP